MMTRAKSQNQTSRTWQVAEKGEIGHRVTEKGRSELIRNANTGAVIYLMPLRSMGESLQNQAVATGCYIQPAIDNFAGSKTCRTRLSAWIRSLPLAVP
jgi:hypothetical protein